VTTTNPCPRCGAERPAHAAFCSKCGTKITPPASSRVQQTPNRHESAPRAAGPVTGSSPAQSGTNRKFSLWVLGLLLLSQVWGLVHRLASGPPVGLGAYGHSSGGVFHYYLDCYPILYVFLIAFFLGLFVMVLRGTPRE